MVRYTKEELNDLKKELLGELNTLCAERVAAIADEGDLTVTEGFSFLANVVFEYYVNLVITVYSVNGVPDNYFIHQAEIADRIFCKFLSDCKIHNKQ